MLEDITLYGIDSCQSHIMFENMNLTLLIRAIYKYAGSCQRHTIYK